MTKISDIVTKSRITVVTRRFGNITNNYMGGLSATFSSCADLFVTFFIYIGGGGAFLGLLTPYKNFCERPWIQVHLLQLYKYIYYV